MIEFVNYAHRGASAYAPENTVSAFNMAIELNIFGIETDLQQTKDKKIGLFHDDTIDAKSNGKGRICDYTYEELVKLDFGSWFDEKYKGEKIVLFEDFAKLYFNKDMVFAIELKEAGFEKEVLDVVKRYNVKERVYITSFRLDVLKNIRREDDSIKISWLILGEINEEKIKIFKQIKGNQICPNAEITNEKHIYLAKENGLGVRLWGVKNEEIMRRSYKLNTEGMTVNFPDKLKKLMEE